MYPAKKRYRNCIVVKIITLLFYDKIILYVNIKFAQYVVVVNFGRVKP